MSGGGVVSGDPIDQLLHRVGERPEVVVDDVPEPVLIPPAQSSTASAKTSSRTRSRSDAGVPTSTFTPSASSSSTPIDRISIGRASGSSSTRKSMSLSPRSSPRATEPNKAIDQPRWRATISLISCRWASTSVRSGVVSTSATLNRVRPTRVRLEATTTCPDATRPLTSSAISSSVAFDATPTRRSGRLRRDRAQQRMSGRARGPRGRHSALGYLTPNSKTYMGSRPR